MTYSVSTMHPTNKESRPYPIVYLDLFCLYVIRKLNSISGDARLSLFIEYRYYILREHFPHKTFGVDQGSLDFFKKTLAYLQDTEKLPDSKEEYVQNYSKWLSQHKLP